MISCWYPKREFTGEAGGLLPAEPLIFVLSTSFSFLFFVPPSPQICLFFPPLLLILFRVCDNNVGMTHIGRNKMEIPPSRISSISGARAVLLGGNMVPRTSIRHMIVLFPSSAHYLFFLVRSFCLSSRTAYNLTNISVRACSCLPEVCEWSLLLNQLACDQLIA